MNRSEVTLHQGHCLYKGDVLAVNGELFIVTSIMTETTLTYRNVRWYDRAKWAIRAFIKDFMRGLTQEIKRCR